MFQPIIKQIQDVLENEIHPKMTKCYKLMENETDDTKKEMLKEKYTALDAYLNRASACLEILNWHALVIKDEVNGMTIVLPGDSKTVKFITEAEKLGGVVESSEPNEVEPEETPF